jgi:Fic family protein
MFKPTYRFTPFLVNCLEEISSQRIVIDQMGKGALKLALIRDSFNRSVHSTTWIEGNSLSLNQVASLRAQINLPTKDQQKLEVTNCIKALEWIIKNSKVALTPEKLLKIHVLMTKDLLLKNRCGKYRNIQNYIVNARGKVIFTPPAPGKVKQRMNDLFFWLKSNLQEHPIIRSAIIHHEFATIHPFTDGNGRVARAINQWLLLQATYDPIWTLELDEYFAKDKAKYYDMIQQTRDMDGDFTHWIEYIAQGLKDSIKIVIKRFKDRGLIQKVKLTPKQTELLEFIDKKGVVGSGEICQHMEINRARVNQLVSPLIKAKVVVREGDARAAKYRLFSA